ncbi:MAG TPA: nucleotide exchange factor GrpE [Sumerlaeia bacterium]|nr:nucleotide exchange factor GrpE [Sumerlaeia bacterium]HUT56385.1 nucleotide exchange factor GrpE [Phycisphaerae bacterium]
MGTIFQELFAREFVIDEPREEVLDLGEKKTRPPAAPRPLASINPPARKDQAERRDLVTQISELLIRQERLESLTDELRSRSAAPTKEELKRLFRSALPVLDSFDRVLQMAELQTPSEEVQNWLKSVATIQSRVSELFKRFGLQTMDPVGKPVNLDRHEVVEVVYSDSVADETVVQVRQKGYMLEGKVLRDARVVVAKRERR